MKKRILSMLLAIAMVVGLVPTQVLAADCTHETMAYDGQTWDWIGHKLVCQNCEEYEWEDHYDENSDSTCDVCQLTIDANNQCVHDENSAWDEQTLDYIDHWMTCTSCGGYWENHYDENSDSTCDVCRISIDENNLCAHTDADTDSSCDVCDSCIHRGDTGWDGQTWDELDHWMTCAYCPGYWEKHYDHNDDDLCDVCNYAMSGTSGGGSGSAQVYTPMWLAAVNAEGGDADVNKTLSVPVGTIVLDTGSPSFFNESAGEYILTGWQGVPTGYETPADVVLNITDADGDGNGEVTTSSAHASISTTTYEGETVYRITVVLVAKTAAPVASVTVGDTTTNYSDITSAIAAAQGSSGSTLKLLDDITSDTAVTIDSGSFTIDLNGKTWEFGGYLDICGSADIKITDSGTDGTGKLLGKGGVYPMTIPTIQLYGSAKLEVAGGTVENIVNNNVVAMEFAGNTTDTELTVSGGKLTTNGSTAILAFGKSVTVTGGTIESGMQNIVYKIGTIDLSGHSDPTGITICNGTGEDVAVSDSTIKLPAGYVMLDESTNPAVAATLAQGEIYTVGKTPTVTEYPLWVGGQQFTSEKLTISGGEGTATYDPGTNTLTLNNYSYSGAGYDGAAIYSGGTDLLKLMLEGTNSVTHSGDTGSYGIYAAKDIKISGSGKLTATGGNATAVQSSTSRSIGIYIGGEIIISGGTVKATGQEAALNSVGIFAAHGISISGGTVEATGSEARYSYGVYAGGIVISGGETIAQGNSGAFDSSPTIADTLAVYAADDTAIENPVWTGEGALTYAKIAPAAPNETNVNVSIPIFAFACYSANTGHQTTGIPFAIRYFEVGAPVKNTADEWIAEVTGKVKAMWEDATSKVYDRSYPGYAHTPKEELPEELAVTLTWDPEAEEWVYRGALHIYDISCSPLPATYTVTVTTAANGTVTADETTAAAGETVTLTVTPDSGYEIDTVMYNDTAITANNGVYAFTMPEGDVTVTVTFKVSGCSASISVIDSASGNALAGASMQILNEEGYVVEEWVSTEEAHTVIGLGSGAKYTLRAAVAPEGYILASDTSFSIDQDGNINSTGTVSADGVMLVAFEQTKVQISAVESGVGEAIAGACMQIINSTGNVVYEWISAEDDEETTAVDESVCEITGLKTGEGYTLHATVAPEGYSIPADTIFAIQEDGRITTTGYVTAEGIILSVFDLTVVQVSAVDLSSVGNPLAGAHLQILDENSIPVEEWVSEVDDELTEDVNESVHTVTGLKTGVEYTLRATVAPEGYITPANITFTIRTDGTLNTSGGILTEEGILRIQFEEAEPEITSVTFNSDSPAYDAQTNTFYIDEEHPLIITVEGKNLRGAEVKFIVANSGYVYASISDIFTNEHTGSHTIDLSFYYDFIATMKINGLEENIAYIGAAINVAIDDFIPLNVVERTYEADITQPEGGNVTTDKENPVKGEQVTITVTPDEGKEVVDVTVTDENGASVNVTDNGDGTYTYEQPAGDVKITVELKVQSFTVSWSNGDGGSYDRDVKYGETITVPDSVIFQETMRRTGYTLTGWSNTEGYEAGDSMPAMKLTFTAQYTANAYTVSFDPNGGEVIERITVTYGEKYGTLPSSAITGFSGGNKNWYLLDADGNVTDTNIKNLSKVETASDHTLFMKRSVLAPAVKITLEIPGGISNEYQYHIPGNSTRILTATVTNKNDALLDYTYQWYKDGVQITGATEAVLTLDGNVSDSGIYKVVVTATLKADSHIVVTANSASAEKEQTVRILRAANTLSYDANGGENAPGSHYTGGETITVALDKPSREHYTFAGWNTRADGSGSSYSAGSTYTFAEDNGNGGCEVTLYAQWTAHTYTVKFDANVPADSVLVSGPMADQTLTYDKKEALTANTYVVKGYKFTGWVYDGTTYTDKQEVVNLAADQDAVITMKAVWDPTDGVSYTVKHMIEKLDGSGYDIHVTDTTRIGKTGASTNALKAEIAGFTVVEPIAQQTIKGDGSTVVEIFYSRNRYTLTFDPANGSEPIVVTMKFEDAITKPADPEKTGHTFAGWNPAVAEKMPASDTAYTAHWTVNTYTVTLITNGGTIHDGDVTEYTYGVGAKLPANVTRSDCYFDGWYDNEEYRGPLVTEIAAADLGSKTFYARWNAIYIPTYPPVVNGGSNGDVSVTPRDPEQGDTVVIIPDPDAGCDVDEITVTDRNGSPVTVVDNGDGTYSFVQPGGKVNIEVTFREIVKVCPGDKTCPMYGYTDLDGTLWYHDGIHYCIEHGLMQGVGNDRFAPDSTTTRAMIVTILWRLEGSPIVNYAMDFEDVAADQWFTEAIRWAASEKIVEGYGDGKFGTHDAITREQMVTVMFRYAKYKGYDVSVGENTNILSYDDAFDVAEWAVPAMQWACGSGVIQGIADGSKMNLAPQGSATRAQAATILHRFCDMISRDEEN